MNAQTGARYATEKELRNAGIINGGRGIFFGYHNGHALYQPIDTLDGSMCIIGGAGSGKSASVNITGELLNSMDCNAVSLDVRGDLTAVTMLSNSLAGFDLYCFNPMGVGGLPQHATNPLDHLTRDNRQLVAETRLIVNDLIPKTDGQKWWVDDAHEIVVHLILHLVISRGRVSLKTLFEAYNNIQQEDAWEKLSAEMQVSTMPDIRAMAHTLLDRKDDGREGFTAPMGVILNTLSFMQVPDIAAAVSEESDFSLEQAV